MLCALTDVNLHFGRANGPGRYAEATDRAASGGWRETNAADDVKVPVCAGGRWQTILSGLKSGDYVMIEFGINEEMAKLATQELITIGSPLGNYVQ